jgi:ATP-binding cassette subfamily B protein/subfamily B ATP-binding cassette protein MsbA
VESLRGEISFDNVHFGYGGRGGVLNGISFRIRAGERVALVGSSGAGKSTIASLILRLYHPQAGTIRIDGIDTRDYQRESMRREIGIVLQDSVLFGASIRENIAYGKPDAPMEEIEAAATRACAHTFIAGLPNGYDTVIGERGCTLSGGQRQRLCLARAIIKRPSILILDEPTSAVDAESAALIQTAVDDVHRGKTLLLIAHQFTGLDTFDRILVLRDGNLVEEGSHAELLQRGGYYCDLLRAQGVVPEEALALS